MASVISVVSVISSAAPNAGQHKAGRSDFPHFAIRAAPGENAENAIFSLSTQKMGLKKSATRVCGKCGKFGKCGSWRKRGRCG